METVLAIAGSDPSGGAGIQADLKTMAMHGVYGMAALTALTAQNTMGVSGILEVPPEFLEEQICRVFEDIRPDAVKIGMVPSGELIRVIAACLERYHAGHIVVDPVMVATSGSRLAGSDAVEAMEHRLLPMAEVITPNIQEAEVLSGRSITSEADMEQAAGLMEAAYGCAVLCKGGHSVGQAHMANDLLYQDGTSTWFYSERIDNPNSHGTGCTLSSAIASNLAKGLPLAGAVEKAKDYVRGALAAMLDLGKGSGPMDHGFILRTYTRQRGRS